jgi:HD-GYP domain-containing protein (c-di-GMP phosphodiesterase class II)
VLKYIRHHHERYDGAGYPDGLKGNIIPLGARIIAVAEAFDAMCRSRPYRKAMSAKLALAELERCTETQFDPQVVAAFIRIYDQVSPNLQITEEDAS